MERTRIQICRTIGSLARTMMETCEPRSIEWEAWEQVENAAAITMVALVIEPNTQPPIEKEIEP